MFEKKKKRKKGFPVKKENTTRLLPLSLFSTIYFARLHNPLYAIYSFEIVIANNHLRSIMRIA